MWSRKTVRPLTSISLSMSSVGRSGMRSGCGYAQRRRAMPGAAPVGGALQGPGQHAMPGVRRGEAPQAADGGERCLVGAPVGGVHAFRPGAADLVVTGQ